MLLPAPAGPSIVITGLSAHASSTVDRVRAGQRVEHRRELRKRGRHARRVLDDRLAVGDQPGDGQRHRDAMIAAARHGAPRKPLGPFDRHAVGPLPDDDAHLAELTRERRDPVGLLDPELGGVADRW